ncbi:enoyl-CoA hydratase-related protein [Microtetraspora sp. NBRC 16547]|uniref:enoyl-CoA hydratase-related protein n=1 Tax=Microtetraspora sp. NBRC 16547 TaxID=3030993 RepID=UPI0024A1DF3A|nr:enoyl-CoA hydratase-related protein [Microtetraspora sp. NBRC 16547]GLW97829.1 enoyl-CoA hydratase [Microtetraspora sp. NBRC 16547]
MLVLSENHDAVRVLTFNRPERLNAWTPEMGRRYFDLLEEAERDPEVRVIVVTGAGRGFCSGADFEALAAIQAAAARAGDEAGARFVDHAEPLAGDGDEDHAELRAGNRDEGHAGVRTGLPDFEPDPRPATFPMTIRKPVIAAVNGACAGLGMVYALVCDLVFTAEDAKWTTAFSRRGLIAEYGLAWILPKLAGQAAAMELLLSGRTFTGSEAYALGLACRAVPGERLLEEVLAYAGELAAHSSPASMAIIKRQVWGDWERGIDESRDRAVRLMMESFGRPDFAEGVAGFLERRPPNFRPL